MWVLPLLEEALKAASKVSKAASAAAAVSEGYAGQANVLRGCIVVVLAMRSQVGDVEQPAESDPPSEPTAEMAMAARLTRLLQLVVVAGSHRRQVGRSLGHGIVLLRSHGSCGISRDLKE